MRVIFSETAWNEYLDWQATDMKSQKINGLIKDIQRNGFMNCIEAAFYIRVNDSLTMGFNV